jgi:hypothetical protein
MKPKAVARLMLLAASSLSAPTLLLGQAHYSPGTASIRDYAMPDPGMYLAVYNYGYDTTFLADNSGNKINQVLIGPSGGPYTPLNVNVDLKLYALAPALLWITKWNVFGAHYGAYVIPAFSNANIAASLSTIDGLGVNPETSQFAVGDMFVQPFWLGWNRKHFDVAAGYGFYAPVGKFDTQTVTFPSGPQVVTAATNTGLGYWTHQVQGNVTWYPNVNRTLAVTNTITAEFNGEQRDTHYTNGDFVSWNWGADYLFPLDKTFHYASDIGVTGYSQWQISDATGPNVTNPNFHDQVHGVGVQAGVINTHLGLAFEFRYLGEYAAANRFRGRSYSLNLGYTIKKPKPPAPVAP